MGCRGQRLVTGGFFGKDPENDDTCQQEDRLEEKAVLMEESALRIKEEDCGSQQDHGSDDAYQHTCYAVGVKFQFAREEKIPAESKHYYGEENPCYEG
jgi:hypothetical protein